MTTHDEIARAAARLLDAIETGDVEVVRAIYAPDAVIWHNTDNLETTVEENLRVLGGFVKAVRERRYQNRRLDVFDGGFVEQHLLTGRRATDGKALSLAACIVCKVSNGRITRLDEYFDSAALAEWRT